MIKSLKKNDIRTTPFTAAKKWNPQNKLHKDLILWQSGSVSGSLSLTFKEYNDGTVAPYTYISSAIALQQQQDDFLRFREGVNLSGSISPTGSFYYDPVLSEKNLDGTYKTVLYATTKHLFYKESQDPTKIFGLESLDSSNVNRSLPNKISTFNIPQNKFGEKVIPKSVVITHEIQGQTYNVVDDGNSNLVVSDKTFINNQDANIDKVAANITLNISTGTYDYDSEPYEITATTKPSNLAYIVTYNGSTTPPTNAGTYTVVATINDNFYQGSVTGIFTIEKTSRTINISNLNPTYDGNPKPVTVSIPYVNVNYDVTYNGSTTPPTNAGTYAVVVTINDLNYKNLPEKDSNGQPNPGSGLATLTIVPQTLTITSQCPSKTYGDEDFTIPVNTVSNGAISYTINSGPAKIINGKIRITGVGTLNVTITQAASGNYSAATVNCSSITVSPKQLTVTGITAADKAYNGDITATLNTSNAALQGVVINPIKPINGLLDVVTLNVGSALGEFLSDSPGEGKTVAISGLTLSGVDNSKYILVQPTTTAAIKASSANGTITMNSATVTYNGSPQSLDVSVNDPNIPIKITYTSGNNVIISVRLYRGTKTILNLNGQYPTDIGKYNVTAELYNPISTTVKYTVPTVTATLEIKPTQGIVTFGQNIFYYDGKPKPVVTLSVTPPNKNLIITYDGSTTVPSMNGSYEVIVKSEDVNIFYKNTVTLSIKSIPTSTAPQTISKESDSPQVQKNIINLASATAVGNVNFSYNLSTLQRFTIEYPLNSGTLVYDSDSMSVNNTSNVNTFFKKEKTGTQNGIDSEKCLITVYSSTNNNSWTYTISAVNASTSVLPTGTVTGIVNIGYILPSNIKEKYAGSNLELLKATLKSIHDGTSNPIEKKEFEAINNIIDKNKEKDFNSSRSVVLLDTDDTGNPKTNIKIIVNYLTSPSNDVAINLQYKRLNNSLGNVIVSGASAIDYHYYKYMGIQTSFDRDDAIKQLTAQISSDTFLNNTIVSNMKPKNPDLVKGNIQRSLLTNFVAAAIQDTSINNARFRFELGLSPLPDQGTVIIEDKSPPTVYKIEIPNAYLDTSVEGCISIDTTNKTVEIIYPFDWSIKK